jgi:teichuronic acid biosynthesis glycosyltransferase TuaC
MRIVSNRASALGLDTQLNLHTLILTPFYPTDRDEAQGCFVSEPLPALAALGVRSTVFAARPFYRRAEHAGSEAMPAEFIRYASLPGGWGLSSAGGFLFARILTSVRELHRRKKIDLIHAHAPLPCGHAAMLLSRELNVPFIVSVHGLDAYSTNQVRGFPGEWCRRLTRRVFRSASRVVCISEHVREQVVAGDRGLRTSVVYNGADPDLFSPRNAEEAGVPSIVTVGNLIPIKGHATLIQAAAAVGASCPTVEVVGDGPERDRLTGLVRDLGIENRVSFHGRLPRRGVARLLKSCTLFVLPSRFEGLGCVYLEAMSSGKVAIGCRGQGIEEVIQHGHNGWLVGPDDVNDLVAALTTLLGNPMLREYIGDQGRQTILSGFTLAHHAERLQRIYQEICA